MSWLVVAACIQVDRAFKRELEYHLNLILSRGGTDSFSSAGKRKDYTQSAISRLDVWIPRQIVLRCHIEGYVWPHDLLFQCETRQFCHVDKAKQVKSTCHGPFILHIAFSTSPKLLQAFLWALLCARFDLAIATTNTLSLILDWLISLVYGYWNFTHINVCLQSIKLLQGLYLPFLRAILHM